MPSNDQVLHMRIIQAVWSCYGDPIIFCPGCNTNLAAQCCTMRFEIVWDLILLLKMQLRNVNARLYCNFFNLSLDIEHC